MPSTTTDNRLLRALIAVLLVETVIALAITVADIAASVG